MPEALDVKLHLRTAPLGAHQIRHSDHSLAAILAVGGKSGTSEQLNMDRRADGDYKKVASFAAVLPADDPEIIVYVMLDDPNNARTDYSSLLAAPVVGNIISEIAPYLGIEQDADYNPTGTVTVQTCLDYTWTNAQVTLNRLGLKHKLIGPSSGNIVYQYPVGGSVVPAGSTIYLYTATDQNSMTTTPSSFAGSISSVTVGASLVVSSPLSIVSVMIVP